MAPNSVRFRSAISILLLLVFTVPCMASNAGVGTVTNLSGPLFAKKTDGSTRTLAVKSSVDQGDMLVSEKRTYGRVKFTDGGEVTLRPGTTFVVESYFFNKDNPAEDKAVFGLVKGSLRAVTGQVSKRGDQNAYKMKTSTATIGVRGTSYDLKVCDNNCPGLANGIYFFVIDGKVEVSNTGGTRSFGVGEYGYVKDDQSAPVLLPFVPDLGFDIQLFSEDGCSVR